MSTFTFASLVIHVCSQLDYPITISGIWNDDYYTAPPRGWLYTNESSTDIADIITWDSSKNRNFHGPYVGDSDVDIETIRLRQKFYCTVPSSVDVAFHVAFCNTQSTDRLRFYTNGVLIGTLQPINGVEYVGTSLDSICSYGWQVKGPFDGHNVTHLMNNQLLRIRFDIAVNSADEAIAVTSISITCNPLPTMSPTFNPISSTTQSPTQLPINYPTLSPILDVSTLSPTMNTDIPTLSTSPTANTYAPTLSTPSPTENPTRTSSPTANPTETNNPTVSPILIVTTSTTMNTNIPTLSTTYPTVDTEPPTSNTLNPTASQTSTNNPTLTPTLTVTSVSPTMNALIPTLVTIFPTMHTVIQTQNTYTPTLRTVPPDSILQTSSYPTLLQHNDGSVDEESYTTLNLNDDQNNDQSLADTIEAYYFMIGAIFIVSCLLVVIVQVKRKRKTINKNKNVTNKVEVTANSPSNTIVSSKAELSEPRIFQFPVNTIHSMNSTMYYSNHVMEHINSIEMVLMPNVVPIDAEDSADNIDDNVLTPNGDEYNGNIQRDEFIIDGEESDDDNQEMQYQTPGFDSELNEHVEVDNGLFNNILTPQ